MRSNLTLLNSEMAGRYRDDQLRAIIPPGGTTCHSSRKARATTTGQSGSATATTPLSSPRLGTLTNFETRSGESGTSSPLHSSAPRPADSASDSESGWAPANGCDPRALGIALVVLTVWLGGCTVVGHKQVEGWPQLRVTEHRVPELALRDRCAQYVGFGMSPQACAEFDLARGTCDIWLSADFPPTASMLEHERLHCKGFDHIGGDTLSNALRQWRGKS